MSRFLRFGALLLSGLQETCKMRLMQALDKLDRQILRSLQADGRATYDQIAEVVGLSPSAVLRRVKRLEEVA
jgi:Lrp/AsnC family transcriptional regulator, leucine-responsive regulatory protein